MRSGEWKQANVTEILESARSLRTTSGSVIVREVAADQIASLKQYFLADPERTSRLEQFYFLMFWMTELVGATQDLDLDVRSVQNLMKKSQAFQSSELIDAITEVKVSWEKTRRAHLKIQLNRSPIVFALNKGRGFKAFQHGYCQHAQKLLIFGALDITIDELASGNLKVTYHKSVDLEGDLGTRGMVDLNIQYISLLQLEFLHGSRLGRTRARISPREFEAHSHPWWLRWISRLVSETATQPIDW